MHTLQACFVQLCSKKTLRWMLTYRKGYMQSLNAAPAYYSHIHPRLTILRVLGGGLRTL